MQSLRDNYHAQNATNTLAEGQSLSSYKRMRTAESFETPEQKKEHGMQCPSKPRKHSPSFDNTTWDQKSVLRDLQNWPQNEPINWTKFATQHAIPGRNWGQIVKEFAMAKEIEVETLPLTGQENSKCHEPVFLFPAIVQLKESRKTGHKWWMMVHWH